MLDWKNTIYAAVAGALFGVGFILVRGWWIKDFSDATALNLSFAAVAGAIAGVAAFVLRGGSGDESK